MNKKQFLFYIPNLYIFIN